jgi:adenosine deaminase
MAMAADSFSLGLDDIEYLTQTALRVSFLPFQAREKLLQDVIQPGFEEARSSLRLKEAALKKRVTSKRAFCIL